MRTSWDDRLCLFKFDSNNAACRLKGTEEIEHGRAIHEQSHSSRVIDDDARTGGADVTSDDNSRATLNVKASDCSVHTNSAFFAVIQSQNANA